MMNIAPGEPVPPGFENEVKAVAELQSTIEKCKDTSLIGLEYILELVEGEGKEPSYICVMCEKRGDPRTIMDHITSYKHRLKYLVSRHGYNKFHWFFFLINLAMLPLFPQKKEKHFPTVTRELAPFRYNRDARDVLPQVIQTICEAIEDSYGRLTPTVYEHELYKKNRMVCLQDVINDKHFDEKMGSTFVHVIDRNAITESIKSKLHGFSFFLCFVIVQSNYKNLDNIYYFCSPYFIYLHIPPHVHMFRILKLIL